MSRGDVRPLRGARARTCAAALTAALLAGLLTGCTATGTDPGPTTPAPSVSPSAPSSSPGPSTEEPAPRPTDTPTGEPTPPPDPATTPAPTPAPSVPPAPEPAPSVVPEPTPTASPPAPEPEPTTLRQGDQGPAVQALQQRLVDLGYFLPSVDGDFGPATQQAVWALQKAAGAARDGLVGPVTQAALDAGTRPAPRSTAGRVIEVDLHRQLVLAVDDGVVTRIINASSGNGELYDANGRQLRAFTPAGDFTVVRQIDAMHESSLGLGQMYRPKYFLKGWAVHGSTSVPPWPASHGCVRVSNAAISWIWDAWGAPIGTPLLVY